jgi:hypothetical protein
MSGYLLSSHVHLCVTGDHAVLLDLRRDRYVGLGPRQSWALAAHVEGWPAASSGQASSPSAPDSAVLDRLLAEGMLTADPARGRPACPAVLAEAGRTLTADELDGRPSPSMTQVVKFLRASLAARLALKWRSIESVVRTVAARKARRAGVNANAGAVAREAAEVFLYLRPLLFGARDECLYDSLALVEFLALHEVYPQWVFGVQTRPFLAHSWVQQGTAVCNDSPEHVRAFTPILVV